MTNVNNGSVDMSDLNDLLSDLIDIQMKELSSLLLNRIVQFLLNLNVKNVNLSSNILEKLISAVISDSDSNNAAVSSPDHSQQTATNLLECVHLQVTKFPSVEGKLLLEHLWSVSVNGDQVHPLAAQILIHLFDDFVCDLGLEGRCSHLLRVIQQLLQSNEKENRQSAYYLMLKLVEIFDTNNAVADAIKCTKKQWSDYVNLLVKLEEEQKYSNFIRFLDNCKSKDEDIDFSSQMCILCKRFLNCDNIAIVYEVVKLIVAHLKLSQLNDWNLMEEFLAVTNRRQLYNVDDDDRSYPLFKNFVSIKELELFIEALVTVPWQWDSVPLYEWLSSLPAEQLEEPPTICKDLLFKLGSRVQELKDRRLNHWPQVEYKFNATINGLDLEDYLILIELMYKNRSVEFGDHDCLKLKIIKCRNFEKLNSYFNKSRLDIIFNSFIREDLVMVFIDKLKQLRKSDHGWLRFFLLSLIQNNPNIGDFYTTEYQLNISLIEHGKDLKKLQKHLLHKLMCKSNEEISLLLAIGIDLFVANQLRSWSEIAMYQLKPQGLLQQGTNVTFKHLAHLLKKCPQRLQDQNVLPAFVAILKKFPDSEAARNIGEYASKHLSIEEQNTLSVDILRHHLYINDDVIRGIFKSTINVAINQSLQEIICLNSVTKDPWLDAIYLDYMGWGSSFFKFVQYTLRQPNTYIKRVAEELLRINKELSETHPHYQSNSREHIIKFYIAEALHYIAHKYECSDQLWSALFSQNDQFNITCMYELIVAKTLPSLEPLLKRLESISTLEPNQLMSLLSVTNIYLHLKGSKFDSEQHQKLVALFQTLMMKKELKACQFVKLVQHKKPIYDGIGFREPMILTVQISAKVNSEDLSAKVRLEASLLIPEVHFLSTPIEDRALMNFGYMFFMSNLQPYTSFGRILWYHMEKLQEFRKAIKSASIESQHKQDITPNPELTPQYITEDDADLIVVASCIDNLTSLNALIQTCKAIKVGTLILNDIYKFES